MNGQENFAQNKCSQCTGTICCSYTTEALDTPRSKADFDHLLWQVSHDHTEIYKDSDGWFLLIRGYCSHLNEDGSCKIYDTRPQICRDYSNDWCESDESAEKHFLLHFTNYYELLAYCKKRYKRW